MKTLRITLQDIYNIPTARIFNPDAFKSLLGVSIDTRTIKKNFLYVAIKGDKYDGHSFVSDAVKKGAGAIIIKENRLKSFENIDIPVITVKDTKKALGDLAALWRSKLNAKVIALTGSNGKTTTKEILTTLLTEKFRVVATKANNNNDIGVPLSIFEADAKTELLVLELGTNHFGEIEYTSNIAQPDIALITNIGESHLEFLVNSDGVLNEKKALFDVTEKRSGKIILNADDSRLNKLEKKYNRVVSFGFRNSNCVSGKILETDPMGRTKLRIVKDNKSKEFLISLPGKSNSYNFLAAVTIGLECGMSFNEIEKSAKRLKGVKQRLEVSEYKGLTLIDDTYNANPNSMIEAIELMKKIKRFKKKIAVLGDMFELGDEAPLIHRKLADVIQKSRINEVYLTGKLMNELYKELKKRKVSAEYFQEREKLSELLKEEILLDSVVLVKGSRGMKMEEFVKTIKDTHGD